WAEEVRPEFEKQGLKAELYALEQLEGLLIKYPNVLQAFFDGKNRVFSSLPEALEVARKQGLQEGEVDTALVGRSQQAAAIRAFLEDDTQKLLLLHGPGGIGKSRLLFESGRAALEVGWGDVYWANVNTFEASTTWTSALPLTPRSLMLFDE